MIVPQIVQFKSTLKLVVFVQNGKTLKLKLKQLGIGQARVTFRALVINTLLFIKEGA